LVSKMRFQKMNSSSSWISVLEFKGIYIVILKEILLQCSYCL
jgi:hypothetical protein